MNGDWQVVDQLGRVHVHGLSRDDANGAMVRLLEMMPNLSMRTERADQKPTEAAPIATAQPLPAIKPGSERESLHEAIDAQLDAAARLDSANQAVERARAFLDARQVELDALAVAHQSEIEASGANLAEVLKAGGAAFETARLIDRSAVLDAEVRCDTAKAALEQLAGEQTQADAAHKAAETAIRLAVMAVKRADVAAMVERLEVVKAEFTALATAIDAARFADVPMTIRAQDATRLDLPGAGSISETAARWHRYSAALRDDSQAAWEDQQ